MACARAPALFIGEVELSDGRKLKAKISPPLDHDYPWNRGKHWFFRSPYRGASPFIYCMVILLLAFNYGWPAVAFFWMYIVFMGVLAITIHLFEKFFFRR
jgi:hypothetical protein